MNTLSEWLEDQIKVYEKSMSERWLAGIIIEHEEGELDGMKKVLKELKAREEAEKEAEKKFEEELKEPLNRKIREHEERTSRELGRPLTDGEKAAIRAEEYNKHESEKHHD